MKDSSEYGVITSDKFRKRREEVRTKEEPLLSAMISGGYITNETLTKITANVTKMPYVNLTNATIDPKILSLYQKKLPRGTWLYLWVK